MNDLQPILRDPQPQGEIETPPASVVGVRIIRVPVPMPIVIPVPVPMLNVPNLSNSYASWIKTLSGKLQNGKINGGTNTVPTVIAKQS